MSVIKERKKRKILEIEKEHNLTNSGVESKLPRFLDATDYVEDNSSNQHDVLLKTDKPINYSAEGSGENVEKNEDDSDSELEDGSDEGEKAASSSLLNFCAKTFRQGLNASNGIIALKQLITAPPGSVADYIKAGGHPLEILRLLEQSDKKNLTSASPVFQSLQIVLMEIIANCPQQIPIAEEACRYLLNSFVPTIHAMLSTNSNASQRKIILKLLTTIVTMSSTLAREILGHLSLHSQVIETLIVHTKPQDKNSVRTCFIHFLMSFLVEGNATLIRALLDKKGALTSIFPGLIYDTPETVNLVLTTIRMYVLENSNVSKTSKLHTFSTPVLQNIIRIYNWKGPRNFSSKTNHKGSSVSRSGINKSADPYEKELVQKSVHEFMLVLCTSHRHGLIFHDKSLGSSGKKFNPIVNTVIQSLERPWEHELPSDLVIKILVACPDLHKSLVSQIVPYLEPRNSEQWMKTINFMIKLTSSMEPACLKLHARELDAKQLASVVTSICLPFRILNRLNFLTQNDLGIRHCIVTLLKQMMQQLHSFITAVDSWAILNPDDMQTFRHVVNKYVLENIHSVDSMLQTWDTVFDNNSIESMEVNDDIFQLPVPSKVEHLETILNLLLFCYNCCPTIFDNSTTKLDPSYILTSVKNLRTNSTAIVQNDYVYANVELKSLELLLCMDIVAFSPENKLFKDILPLVFSLYSSDDTNIKRQAGQVLNNLLKSTSLFEGNETELDIWLYSFLNLNKEQCLDVSVFLVEVIVSATKYAIKYLNQISLAEQQVESNETEFVINTNKNFDDIFENLGGEITTISLNEGNLFGPLLVAALNKLESDKYKQNESIATYISFVAVFLFHTQQRPGLLLKLLESSNLDVYDEYLKYWSVDSEPMAVIKPFSSKSLFTKVSKALIANKEICIKDMFGLNITSGSEIKNENKDVLPVQCKEHTFETPIDSIQILCLVQMSVFYASQLATKHILTLVQINNVQEICISSLELLLQLEDSIKHQNQFGQTVSYLYHALKCIFTNVAIFRYFSPLCKHKQMVEKLITDFVNSIIKCVVVQLKLNSMINPFLVNYREKLINKVRTSITKCQKHKVIPRSDNVVELMQLFEMNFQESVLILGPLLELNFFHFVSEENEISTWTKVLAFLLQNISDLKDKTDVFECLPDDLTCKLGLLYVDLITKVEVEINFEILETSLLCYIQSFPHSIDILGNIIFKNIFHCKRINKSTSKLAACLLERDHKQLAVFEKCAAVDNNLSKKELILPLLSAALTHGTINKELSEKIYKEHKIGILKILTKPQKAGIVYKENSAAIAQLLKDCMDLTTCKTFTNKINKYDVAEEFHMLILHDIYDKMLQNSSELKFVTNYFILSLQMLTVILKRDSIDLMKIKTQFTLTKKWMSALKAKKFEGSFENVLKNAAWQTFYKFALKFGLRTTSTDNNIKEKCHKNALLLKILAKFSEWFYEPDNADCVTLFQMSSSHSEFLNVLLSPENNDTKTNLLYLLFVLACKNKGVMLAAHVPVFLGAYHATLSQSDRFILGLLHLYEKSGVSLYEYRPYLWGEAASNHYSIRSSIENNLWRQPSMGQVLDLLDEKIVDCTIRFYPIWRSLDASVQVMDKEFEEEDFSEETDLEVSANNIMNDKIYDPAFLLPLLGLLLAPEAAAVPHKANTSGATALAWGALGSQQTDVRGAACHVLHRLRGHIDAQRNAKDKKLWLQLVDGARGGIVNLIQSEATEIPALSSISSVFLSRVSQVLTRPLTPLYHPLANFLLAKQNINFKTVPEMLQLLHSPEVEYKSHRIWLLELIRDGMRSNVDFEMVLNSFGYKFIMDFYTSSLSDNDSRILILSIINNTVKIPKPAQVLVTGHGLFPWLQGVILKLSKTDLELVNACISILNNVHQSLVRYTGLTMDKTKQTNDVKLGSDFLYMLTFLHLQLLPKLSLRINTPTIGKYLNTLKCVTKNYCSCLVFQHSDVQILVNLCKSIIGKYSETECLLKFGQIYVKHADNVSSFINKLNSLELDESVIQATVCLREFVISWLGIIK